MTKITPPSNIVHFPETEQHRKRRSQLSSLEKCKPDKRLTARPVGLVDDRNSSLEYLVLLENSTATMCCGRNGWALRILYMAGEKGVSPIDYSASRWANYIYNLRRMGYDIETVREPQRGSFPGTHARYFLRSDVIVLRAPKATS